MEWVRIQDTNYVKDDRIWIGIKKGEEGEVDLAELLQSILAAQPLKDTASCAQFHLAEWPTLSRDCGFDIALEYLYELSREQKCLPIWQPRSTTASAQLQ